MSLPHWENISKGDTEISNRQANIIRAGRNLQTFQYTHKTPSLIPPRHTLCRTFMKRIKDTQEAETLDNARKAYDTYSDHKHSRDYVIKFEENLEKNLLDIVESIKDDTWKPKGYHRKVIFEKKRRVLAKAPIVDHVTEAAAIRPYEKAMYDYSTYLAPAVKPGLGTHAFMRMMRNELFRDDQEEEMFYVPLDAHHYFPRMDHDILKAEIVKKIKPGKLRNTLFKVIDSYIQGAPLGIKVSQIFGQFYLASFDRLALRFFDIADDPDKMELWTRKYIEGRIVTATIHDYKDLCRGPQYLAAKFRAYVEEGITHYMRFVDNIIIRHRDKTCLHIITQLCIIHLSRDWHVEVNKDYNVRPVWMGIHVCGYVFYHDRVLVAKANKQRLARRIHRLQKAGLDEEQIRLKCASQFGYIKHVNSINLIKSLGMEKSLGKIIRRRRVQSPFEGLTADNKVKFSSICNDCKDNSGGVKR